MNPYVLPPKRLLPLPPDHTPLDGVRFTVVDTETTGRWNASRMVELATVCVLNGRLVDEWSRLIHPGCTIPQDAMAIHGITDDMVRNAPRASEVLPGRFPEWEPTVLVAHASEYDEGVLSADAARANMWIPTIPILDTLTLARYLLEPQASYSLKSLTGVLGIHQEEAHRALSDARDTARLLLHLLDLLKRSGGQNFGDLARISRLSRLGTTAGPLQDLPASLILLRPALLARSEVEIRYRKDGRTRHIPCTLDCGFRHGQRNYLEVVDHRKRHSILTLRLDLVESIRPLAV